MTYEEANLYLTEEVLHNTAWVDADESKRNRALKNASNELYATFSRFNPDKKPLPDKAVYEQALWLLRKDDVILRAEQGVTNVNLSGAVQMTVSGASQKISPAALQVLALSGGGKVKVGRYV